MTDEIEIIPAVAGQKNKASTYNENFNRMKNYVISSVEASEDYVQQQLTTYSNVNTLATSGTVALTDNSVNSIVPTGAVTFELPTITGEEAGKFHQILVQMKLDSIDYFSTGGIDTNYFFNGIAPAFVQTGNYDLIYSYDRVKTKWCAGVIYKGEVTL